MKLAFIKTTETISAHGGVRIQCLMWADGLSKLGHQVDLVTHWGEYDWPSYDAIIVFEFGGYFRNLMKFLPEINSNIVFAPIFDPKWSKHRCKFFIKYWGNHKYLGLSSRFHDFYIGSKKVKLFLTRSDQETEYVSYCCDIPKSKIAQIPLSLRFEPLAEMPVKENFCFHASRLCSENKNVGRLIDAAKKYQFPLVLAGFLQGERERIWLSKQINGCENIKYVGEINDEELLLYYRRAKVFALPSLTEGVGMVALEAAGYGCEIVLTNVGAPKDYFKGHAELVNPYSIDEIGQAIQKCLKYGKAQPTLLKFIKENYSVETCSKLIVKALQDYISK